MPSSPKQQPVPSGPDVPCAVVRLEDVGRAERSERESGPADGLRGPQRGSAGPEQDDRRPGATHRRRHRVPARPRGAEEEHLPFRGRPPRWVGTWLKSQSNDYLAASKKEIARQLRGDGR